MDKFKAVKTDAEAIKKAFPKTFTAQQLGTTEEMKGDQGRRLDRRDE